MAPVAEGMCQIESLINGNVNLWHVALMNDVIATRGENRRRATDISRNSQ